MTILSLPFTILTSLDKGCLINIDTAIALGNQKITCCKIFVDYI